MSRNDTPELENVHPSNSTTKDWTFRRIVVGTNDRNVPIFARDEAVTMRYAEEFAWTSPRTAEWKMWAEDHLPIPLPTGGLTPGLDTQPTAANAFEALSRASTLPPAGSSGVRIFWYEFGPDYKGTDTTPFHWHDSTEVWSIATGEVVLILDGGAERTLCRGATVVVTGVNHRWENRSGKSCIASVVSLASQRTGPKPPAGDDLTEQMTSPWQKK